DEGLGILPEHRLAVSLARTAQHHPENPTAPPRPIARDDRRAQPKVHLGLFGRLAFHPPHPRGLPLTQLAREALHRLIRTLELMLGHQVLPDALRVQPLLQLALDHRLATPATALRPGGHFGWFWRLCAGGHFGRV